MLYPLDFFIRKVIMFPDIGRKRGDDLRHVLLKTRMWFFQRCPPGVFHNTVLI